MSGREDFRRGGEGSKKTEEGRKNLKMPPASSQGGYGAARRRAEIEELSKLDGKTSPVPLEVETTPVAGPGVTVPDGENRRETALGYEARKRYSGMWGRKFALNSASVAKYRMGSLDKPGGGSDRPRAIYADTLGSTTRLFAETVESDGDRIRSETGELTNEQVLLDNYEFVLKNTGAIKENIARVLLAKMDLDRDLRGTAESLVKDSKSGLLSEDPDAVINEAFARDRILQRKNTA